MTRLGLLMVRLACASSLFVAAPIASAQDAQAPTEVPKPANTEETPEIVVQGWRRDKAMDAFMRGDFATAEIEFRNNARCIRRQELQFEAGVRDATSLAPSNGTEFGNVNLPPIFNQPQRVDEIIERTCHSKEWQLYMIGLSQIQLGRYAEAKRSLYSVTRMSKEDLLFDAHFRVALLELLDGNIKRADRRLSHLDGMQRICTRRGSRCEIHADLDAAVEYLRRAIADARAGRLR